MELREAEKVVESLFEPIFEVDSPCQRRSPAMVVCRPLLEGGISYNVRTPATVS
jgi:hypothetical protein